METKDKLIEYTYEAKYTITITAKNQDEADEIFEEAFIETWKSEGNIWDIFDVSIFPNKTK